MLVFSRTRDHSEDFHKFRENTLDYLKSIYSGTSADIQTLILDLIWGLLMKVKVPEEEASKVLVNVKEGDDVGILFENLEPWDWKGANEELKRERERADTAEARADTAEARAIDAEKMVQDIRVSMIKRWKLEGRPVEEAISDLVDILGMEERLAWDLWNEVG